MENNEEKIEELEEELIENEQTPSENEEEILETEDTVCNEDIPLEEETPKENKSSHLRFLKSSLTYVLSCLIYFVVCSIAKRFKVDRLAFAFKDNTIAIVMLIFAVVGLLILIIYSLNCFVKPINNFFKKLKKKLIDSIYSVVDLFSIIPVCFTVVTIFFCFFMSVAKVDGSSMEYTIEDSQTVLVSYLQEIKRFDCVIVSVNAEDNFSVHQNDFYIKRVIGIPGDSVRWDSQTGQLFVNDELINESYLSTKTVEHNVSTTGYNSFNGPFRIKEDGKTVLSDIIPEGYYFVMGDNRNVSKDSRMIGLIKKENVLGKVIRAF